VIKGGNGKIYSGTADGILEIDGLALRQYGRMPGYVTIDKKGNPAIDSTGLRFYKERKYLHLLPYPEMAREEYHAGTDDQFYVCSGGRLYFFDIVPYAYSYPNHSFRAISKDFLGTYSGIYLKGKKWAPRSQILLMGTSGNTATGLLFAIISSIFWKKMQLKPES
jgi:hypothetical protein